MNKYLKQPNLTRVFLRPFNFKFFKKEVQCHYQNRITCFFTFNSHNLREAPPCCVHALTRWLVTLTNCSQVLVYLIRGQCSEDRISLYHNSNLSKNKISIPTKNDTCEKCNTKIFPIILPEWELKIISNVILIVKFFNNISPKQHITNDF